MSFRTSSERPQRTTKNRRPSRFNDGADEEEILQASQEVIPSKKKRPSRFNDGADDEEILQASQEVIPSKKKTNKIVKRNSGGVQSVNRKVFSAKTRQDVNNKILSFSLSRNSSQLSVDDLQGYRVQHAQDTIAPGSRSTAGDTEMSTQEELNLLPSDLTAQSTEMPEITTLEERKCLIQHTGQQFENGEMTGADATTDPCLSPAAHNFVGSILTGEDDSVIQIEDSAIHLLSASTVEKDKDELCAQGATSELPRNSSQSTVEDPQNRTSTAVTVAFISPTSSTRDDQSSYKYAQDTSIAIASTSTAEDVELSTEVSRNTELPSTSSTLLVSSAAAIFLSQNAQSSQKGRNARHKNASNVSSTPALPALQSNFPLAPLAEVEFNDTEAENEENFPAVANTERVDNQASKTFENEIREELAELKNEIKLLRAAQTNSAPLVTVPPNETVQVSNNPSDQSKKVSFTLLKTFRDEAYNKATLQGVIKSLGLAYVTPKKVLEEKFRDKTMDKKLIDDVIKITRLVLRQTCKTSKRPICKIVRDGENMKVINRNRKTKIPEAETDDNRAAQLSSKEAINSFSNKLTYTFVLKTLSDGFKSFRNAQKRT